ncbi:unnamed protein product [Rhizophagus irregularis]|nr:unnamed protein product [Rhizophagus irregularis]
MIAQGCYLRTIFALAQDSVAVTVHGPQRVSNPGHVPCCLQQGPMIIGNYRFYKDKDNLKDPIATIWKGRQWINGYSENNSVDPNDRVYRSQTDCDKVYQGAIEYKRADYFDPSMFPSPGESVIIAMDSPYHSQVITAAAPKISGIQENEMINTPKSNVTVCTENLKPIELTKSSPSKFRVQ